MDEQISKRYARMYAYIYCITNLSTHVPKTAGGAPLHIRHPKASAQARKRGGARQRRNEKVVEDKNKRKEKDQAKDMPN